MRKLSADWILHPEGKLVTNHTLVVDDNGKVLDLHPGTVSDALHHHGILSPGFINAHCHLELSHLENKISRNGNMDGFIREFISARKTAGPADSSALSSADNEMWENGIQGVGDICNTDDSFQIKVHSRIRYHSFLEVFDFNPQNADKAFQHGMDLFEKAAMAHLHASVTPHAPYSTPPELLRLIKTAEPKWWSIHFQESDGEKQLFNDKTGPLADFFRSMHVPIDWIPTNGGDSVNALLPWFPSHASLMFVHNTFMQKQTVETIRNNGLLHRSWFSLCVNANLYIENRLPDIRMLHQQGCKFVIGTDSLASNSALSVLNELKTIHANFPEITVETLLTWATSNGAAYFNWNDLGSFHKNTRPGVILITHAGEHHISPESEVLRLIN